MARYVVYTCITDGYDTPAEVPPAVLGAVSGKVDFLLYTDTPEAYSGLRSWQVLDLPEDVRAFLSSDDPHVRAKAQRLVKACPFRWLPEGYDASLWVDGNIQIAGDLLGLLSRCDLSKSPVWVPAHPDRKCVYEEGLAVVRLGKDTKESVDAQLDEYMKERYPVGNGLAETNILLRSTTDETTRRMCYMWAGQIVQFSHRDQLSFDYCCWKTGLKYGKLDTRVAGKTLPRLPHRSFQNSKGNDNRKRRKEELTVKEENKPRDDTSKIKAIDVVVSLTTHGKRLKTGTFIKAINSIISQKTSLNVKIAMTLFRDDLKHLSVKSKEYIEKNNIDLIIGEENLRPHLKYFYAMQKYRDVPIITVDDDCIYENTLVESLFNDYLKYKNCVIAKRVHEITYDDTGNAKPYNKWIYECNTIGPPSFDLCATGVGGVLYPPNILKISNDDLDVVYISLTNDDLFLRKKETSLGVRVKYCPPSSGSKSYKLLEEGVDETEALCLTDNVVKNDKIIKLLNFSKKDVFNLPIFKSSIQMCEADAVNVLYITDSKYIEPTLVSIKSLKCYKSSRNYSVYVIGDNLNKNDISKLKDMEEDGFSVIMVKIPDNMFDKNLIQQVNKVSKSAIYKFFIAELLPHLNKVLYIDGDTLILDCIDELYNKNVDDVYAAVVKDYKINVEYTQPFFKKLIKAHGGYFNSGMMLLNLYLLRRNKLAYSMLKYRQDGINFFMDQDTLNVQFGGHVRWLEPKYNFIASNFLFAREKVEALYGVKIPNGIEAIEFGDTKPIVFHMTGIPKPWDDKKSIAYPIYKKFKDDIK